MTRWYPWEIGHDPTKKLIFFYFWLEKKFYTLPSISMFPAFFKKMNWTVLSSKIVNWNRQSSCPEERIGAKPTSEWEGKFANLLASAFVAKYLYIALCVPVICKRKAILKKLLRINNWSPKHFEVTPTKEIIIKKICLFFLLTWDN